MSRFKPSFATINAGILAASLSATARCSWLITNAGDISTLKSSSQGHNEHINALEALTGSGNVSLRLFKRWIPSAMIFRASRMAESAVALGLDEYP